MQNAIAQMLGISGGFSDEEKDVYKTVFDATENIPGFCLSGKDNILAIFSGKIFSERFGKNLYKSEWRGRF